MVEVGHIAGRGRILRASRNYSPGVTLLTEKPIFLCAGPMQGSPLYQQFCKLPMDTQEEILQTFFCPMDSAAAQHFKLATVMTGDADRVARFMTIVHFNAVACAPVSADGSGRVEALQSRTGLFRKACMAAHSCTPNAYWYTQDDTGTRVVRSLTEIRQEEEVFINYLAEDDLLLPKTERRKLLRDQKEFLCKCPRCVSDLDDNRVFPCAGCPGTVVARPDDTGKCEECGRALAQSFLLEEKKLLENLDHIDYILDNRIQSDITAKLLRLKPVHPYHYLTNRLARAMNELMTQLCEYNEAVKAQEMRVECWLSKPFLRVTRGAAIELEELGDKHLAAGQTEHAVEAFLRACRVHAIVQEPLHPYCLCCLRKLAASRLQLPADRTPITEGAAVFLRGLEARNHNGQVGICQGFDDGRYSIKLPTCVLKVKQENAEIIAEGIIKLGDIVLIHGLTTPEGIKFNGQVGSVENEVRGRYVVRLIDESRPKSLKPSNLGLSHLADF